MSAVDDLFRRLRTAGRPALLPFLTAGDPDLAFTADALRVLRERGADLCEVGVPYSDPIADGPVIQASYTRALERGVKLADIFHTLAAAAPAAPPLVTMVSYAIVLRHGAERFLAEAQAAGVAGAIVPDLPADESAGLAELCQRADFSLIQLVAPTTPRERALRIAEHSSGFLYYVSVTGITGERRELPPGLAENVAWLRERTSLPICVGFGVSGADQARALRGVADGVIVGSALVRRLAEGATRPRAEVLAEAGAFVAELRAALEAD